MENISLYLVFAIIVISIVLLIVRRAKMLSRRKMEAFLDAISHSFHEAKWNVLDLQEKKISDNSFISREITKKLKTDVSSEFKLLIQGLFFFPKKCFKSFSGDEATNRFASKVYDSIEMYYFSYNLKQDSLENIEESFFIQIQQEIIPSMLEKDQLLHD